MAKKNNKGVTFQLHAPYNEYVALIGEWNNWQPTEMKRGDDGWWRVDVPLEDGEYEYKFQVKSKSFFAEDQMLTVVDPRGVRILDEKHENTCVTVKNGEIVITSYQWKHDDKPLPPNDQLVIYEMHVADFVGGPGDDKQKSGTFKDVTDKLDYLADLGVNAIELMPVNEFPGDRSWGYTPRVLFAVENSYGHPDDLCRLVDECHARGMRVIMDGVYNHTHTDAPLAQIDHNYWYYDENPDPPHLRWGPKFNHTFFDDNLKIHPSRDYCRDAIRFFIEHFHIDGIRFDATYVINSYEFLHWLKDEIYKFVNGMKPFILIAEHVPEDPSITGMKGPLDAAWQDTFCKQMMALLMGTDHDGRQPYNMDGLLEVLDPRRRGYDSPRNVINYLDDHDQERVMWLLGKAGILDDAAFRRNKLGASLFLTSPGTPMLWMGQEFGESHERTLDRQPIDWALLQNDRNKGLYQHYCGLIDLRRFNPALQTENIEFTLVDYDRRILAFKRWNDQGNVVMVVANLNDSYAGEFSVGGLEDGTWHEHIYNYDNHVQGGTLRDTLGESEVKIFIQQ